MEIYFRIVSGFKAWNYAQNISITAIFHHYLEPCPVSYSCFILVRRYLITLLDKWRKQKLNIWKTGIAWEFEYEHLPHTTTVILNKALMWLVWLGFEITKKNHCDGDTVSAWSLKQILVISITVIYFPHFSNPVDVTGFDKSSTWVRRELKN